MDTHQILRLSIPEPCHENWENMVPNEIGVYCQSCSKEVTDFTSMTDTDIFKYLDKRRGQKLCGRFKNTQLERPIIYISPKVFRMRIAFWKKFLAALFICFSGLISGCETKVDPIDKIDLEYIPPVTQNIPTPKINEAPFIDSVMTKPSKSKKGKKKQLLVASIDSVNIVFIAGMFTPIYEHPAILTDLSTNRAPKTDLNSRDITIQKLLPVPFPASHRQ
jgi:hypothetical protein